MTRHILIGMVRLYQMAISPFFPQSCRFYPTCSEYAVQAIQRYGAIKGLGKAGLRIMKCHPLHPGGYDPV
ncbi:MAG TPA: membrane protein insertion efficiency factor YidD [Deltaproteobacteria bacterium]|nr:membrane protein insertion efficiency factor YidD [Deltaproteobacteria bacterium]